MGKQRLKRVQAGRLVREVLWTPTYPCDSPRARAEKSRTSSAARIKINQRCAWQKLKLLLAANFVGIDLHVVLTYDDAHLPKDREAARKNLKRFLVQLRNERRRHGGDLKYVYTTEGRHGAARLHHHIIIDGTGKDYELIRSLWIYGNDIDFSPVNVWGYEELAKYFTKEAREGKTRVGERSYVPSLNLRKPESPPAEWVPNNVQLDPPANAHIILAERVDNEFGRYQFMEYMLPEPPKAKKTRPKKASTAR